MSEKEKEDRKKRKAHIGREAMQAALLGGGDRRHNAAADTSGDNLEDRMDHYPADEAADHGGAATDHSATQDPAAGTAAAAAARTHPTPLAREINPNQGIPTPALPLSGTKASQHSAIKNPPDPSRPRDQPQPKNFRLRALALGPSTADASRGAAPRHASTHPPQGGRLTPPEGGHPKPTINQPITLEPTGSPSLLCNSPYVDHLSAELAVRTRTRA